jgi:two-component system phosphate regulon sensor histidine kinase PhoR
MIEMVSELLELSRIEMGKAELKLGPVNLNALIRDTILRLGTQAERQQLTVTMEPALGLPPVSADKEMVGEVVTNILQNAIKFTPPGGKVKVHTGVEGGEVVVSISDTGIGIGPEDLPHIFERFYKADKARNSAGTGLGLAIARHIIQVHGGRIWVESEPGKGSTFIFTLPLNPSPQKIAV